MLLKLIYSFNTISIQISAEFLGQKITLIVNYITNCQFVISLLLILIWIQGHILAKTILEKKNLEDFHFSISRITAKL